MPPSLPLPPDSMPIAADALISPPLLSAAEVRTAERDWHASHPAESLMERAGRAAAELAGDIALDTGAPVLVLAGPGNNGGDALVAARHLAQAGCRPVVVGRADPGKLSPDAAAARAVWLAAGGKIDAAMPQRDDFSLVVDGLFGAGLTREITGIDAHWIERTNALACPRLALDVPSGLDADTGTIRGSALRADLTLCFIALKPGLFTADGPDCVGQVLLDTLGVADLPATAGSLLTRLEARHQLPPRRMNSHKGTYGHVGVVGAAPGLVGAGLIAGRAALAQGAGAVTLAPLDERIAVDYGEPRLMFATPETLLERPLSALAVGPGLGLSDRAARLLDAAISTNCPLVLDADALNLLAVRDACQARLSARSAPTLLTPHPGEAARLLGKTVAAIQADRVGAARRLSARFGAHVALKGAGTVIAHPEGHYAINTTGGPWLAQAGSGDRLTGMVLALLGQGLPAGEALEAAVWLHGHHAASAQTPDDALQRSQPVPHRPL
ncbi:MAG: NAD(P)H-hydrate dehydratase [Thiobacillus sp.]